MKCLEKDRGRRYETANGLASDIQRHLSNEPVVACPPSKIYRLQKMVRRNRAAVAAGIAILPFCSPEWAFQVGCNSGKGVPGNEPSWLKRTKRGFATKPMSAHRGPLGGGRGHSRDAAGGSAPGLWSFSFGAYFELWALGFEVE